MFIVDLVHRHVAGALDHHLHVVLPGALRVSSPSVCSSANCAASFASARQPGRRPSPSEKVTSYCAHDLADARRSACRAGSPGGARSSTAAMSEPPRETMPVMRCAVERDVLAEHAGVDGQVVDALLRLVLEHVAVDRRR